MAAQEWAANWLETGRKSVGNWLGISRNPVPDRMCPEPERSLLTALVAIILGDLQIKVK
jgi:hypothetical protein